MQRNRGPRERQESGGRRSQPSFEIPPDDDLRKIIEEGDGELTVKWSEQIGKSLAEARLTTSQIRNVFGEVRRIDMNWGERSGRETLLLKPKLAYQASRHGEGVENLRSVLDPAIDLVRGDQRRFGHFMDFFESLLAYHRAYGGRD